MNLKITTKKKDFCTKTIMFHLSSGLSYTDPPYNYPQKAHFFYHYKKQSSEDYNNSSDLKLFSDKKI